MKKQLLLLLASVSIPLLGQAQVGVNTTTPDASAALEIKNTGKGLLIPRVALTSLTDATTIANPAASLLVYNTSAGIGTGYYFNAGSTAAPQWQRLVVQPSLDATNATVASLGLSSWRTNGNALTATGQFGSSSNNHLDLMTNNQTRARMTNAGEFIWGATAPVLTGDLLDAVGNTTQPFAVSGYSNFNGSGLYGGLRGTSTSFYGAVQGENSSTGHFNSAGVRGINSSTTAGTGFRSLTATGPVAGVVGNVSTGGAYTFGVHGSSPSTTVRSGGLFGDDAGYAMGAVGYFAANGNDYSMYGFGGVPQNGGSTGRSSGAGANAHIGLGIAGGVMGGWVRGSVYGLHARGERYSLYVDGQAITNQPLAQLVTQANGQRVATYAPSSPSADVYVRGRAELQDGQAFVAFPEGFAQLLSNPQEATITVTPTGDTRGVFVERITEAGFYVRENQGGHSRAVLGWTATGTRRGSEAAKLSAELLDSEFDPRMSRLMSNEADPNAPRQALWYDGQQVRYDTPPAHQPDPDIATGARPVSKSAKP